MSQTLGELQRRISLADVEPGHVFGSFREGLVELLEVFNELHDIPIALILNGRQEYLSPPSRMQQFCSLLWTHDKLKQRCLRDHQKRSAQDQAELRFASCHAGLLNLSLRLDCGPLGEGALLAGQRIPSESDSTAQEASRRNYERFVSDASRILSPKELEEVKQVRCELGYEASQSGGHDSIRDREYVVALGKVVEKYIRRRYKEELARIVLDRGLARVLHEVGNASVYMELQARGLLSHLPEYRKDEDESEDDTSIRTAAGLIKAMALEARYECQNLLSAIDFDAAFTRQQSKPVQVDVMDVLRELFPTFDFLCENEKREIQFSAPGGTDLAATSFPSIEGYPDLLRRAFFNVFSNALKYSYRSDAFSSPFIGVGAFPFFTTTPRRFAVSFSNYGICFKSEAEKANAKRFGFRGQDAINERPVGSGIGLAEVEKILRLHRGYLEIESRPIGKKPAHTVVWLVFNQD